MRFLKPKTYNLKPSSRGQGVLALVFLIGGITALVGLSVAFLATSFVNSTYGFQAAQRAEIVASAGVYDALMRLARDKDCCTPSNYSVPVGNDTADVTITQNSPAAGQATINSQATVSSRQRRIRAVVSIDSNSGLVTPLSWNQTQ